MLTSGQAVCCRRTDAGSGAAAATRRRANIYGGNAFVRFRGDGRNVSCGSWDFARIPLGSRSKEGFDSAYVCDAQQPRDPGTDPYLGHPLLKTFPHLETLRVDVRARDDNR